jgi:hypothetical protein
MYFGGGSPMTRYRLPLSPMRPPCVPRTCLLRKTSIIVWSSFFFREIMYVPELTGTDYLNPSYQELHLGVPVLLAKKPSGGVTS